MGEFTSPPPPPQPRTDLEMDKYDTLQKIVEQLEFCNYKSEAGSLKNNVAFMSLKKMANVSGI